MRRRRSERGATLIEVAIVAPLLVTLFLGVVEFGFAWRDVNTIERALQTAGRVGASASTTRFADYDALRALDSVLGEMAGTEVQRVVVFRSTSANGAVPDACKTAASGVAGVCNVYTRAQLETANPVGFPVSGSSCAGAWDEDWCPMSRSDSLPNPDYLGIWLQLRYSPFTSIIPGPTLDIERSVVFQVEPCIAGGAREC